MAATNTPALESSRQKQLVEAAMAARSRAYAPYSQFTVGAAILCADGSVFRGCNVENGSFSLTICAERVAMVAAIAAGNKDAQAIAIAASPAATPCGACRQFLAEFNASMRVLLVDAESAEFQESTLVDLLPNQFRFSPKN